MFFISLGTGPEADPGGHAGEIIQRLYLSAVLGTPADPPGGVGGSIWEEECLGFHF